MTKGLLLNAENSSSMFTLRWKAGVPVLVRVGDAIPWK